MESRGMRVRVRVASIALVVALLWSGASASAGGITIYWGQITDEASLAQTCASGNFEIVIVSYLLINGTINSETPELNLAGHSTNSLNVDIKSCQSSGVKVFLSLDGAVANADHAQYLSSYLWDNFLEGNSGSGPVGDAIVDGIDFGIYEATTQHWDDLALAISNLSTSSKKVYLSAAPQCPYPDAWLGTALKTGLFDYVWIQFFNNIQCEYVTDATDLLSSWNEWTNSKSVHTVQTRGFYLGLAAAPGFTGTGGYIEPDKLISEVLPQIKASSKYGGVTLWTKYWDEQTNYSSSIKPYVNISDAPAADIGIYWGQNTEEASLGETCASGNFKIVVVSYLLINGTINAETPELNLAGHPTNSLNADIKSCQSSGVKVFMSLDGAVANAEHAQGLASYLWENFLEGNSGSGPVGDAVLDGIDFGDYEASTEHWDDLVTAISNLSTSSSKVYLSAAPQCPYPDRWLDKALQTGLFDYVWIQFFNNPTCEYAENDTSKLVSSWNEGIDSVQTLQTRGFFLGLPAAPGYVYSGGYIEPNILTSDVLPQIKPSSKYGGVMLWTKYWDEKTNYSSSIKLDIIMKPSPVDVPTLASV
ncbi:hypothetical protein SUGI_0383880 [Cryptomeria japonica]|uniref:chitinase 1-like n=1 Tax=Cryptomeria japonica TaxID=3369 RepID=UPI002408D84C|nr:chitinase 1-like [Cryptomeria japonica]GLJ21003.1 hypothetical protein SUGI_0383880 [Cryptomeria japonica]